MTSSHGLARTLRERGGNHRRVTFFELFFDLVFVFAITQLSHLLIEHLSVHGAMQTLLLMLAIWSAWIYSAWFTNWFDPNQRIVRLALIGIMLASLIMSAMLPDAFGERGLIFAVTFVSIQVGRTIFAVACLREQPALHRNFQRILCWLVASGLLWVGGGIADGSTRELLWLGAVLLDYIRKV